MKIIKLRISNLRNIIMTSYSTIISKKANKLYTTYTSGYNFNQSLDLDPK